MSTSESVVTPVPQLLVHKVHKPRETKKWIDWVTTTDHKRIGIMYMVTDVRLLHARRRRGAADPPPAGRAEQHAGHAASIYNELLTMHGTTMVFLFVVADDGRLRRTTSCR